MKLNIISDLHLEFSNFFHNIPHEANICILPGDIGVGLAGIEWAKYLNSENDSHKHIIYVAGNHEFYQRKVMSEFYGKFITRASELNNFHFLQNNTVIINGTKFIGATLWTDFNFNNDQKFSLERAKFYMNDYRQILEDKNKLITSEYILNEFCTSKNYIETELNKPFLGPTVVITHHGVGDGSIHPYYKDKSGNEYFVSDLTSLIQKYNPNLWIHGHTHSSVDCIVGNTRVLANPRGYHINGITENKEFDPSLIVEI